MADKQIIIDSVDVSGCKKLMQGIVPFGCMEDRKTCSCMNNPNCLYKQFKCQEQENKRLKEDEKSLLNIIDDLQKEKNKWVEKYNDLGQDFDQLKHKEQECNKLYIQLKADEEYHKEEENTLRKIIKNKEERNIELYKENNQLKVNNEKMSKGYAELTEIVRPYIEDFTGYNEKLGGFDIVLCVKELLEQFKHLQTENEKIKESRDYYKRIVDGCPDVCENGFCQIDFYNKKLTKTIIEIKEYLIKECKICKEQCAITNEDCADCQAQEILQKISECEVENGR